MKYDFDSVVDRAGTWSLKYDCAAKRGMPLDLLPMWVADMDFKTAPAVTDALVAVARHGIFGYSDPDDSYFNAVQNWFKTRHNYEVRRDWLVKTPGVVYALAMAVEAYTDKGDAVLIQPPVYYPFHEVVDSKKRRLITNPLKLEDGVYSIDFEDFERKIADNDVKMFILCSPHNPVGRVWARDELEQLGDICLKHGVIVVSDEIHADFTYNCKHTAFASIKPEFADIAVVCTAPSKTFNLAGLQLANIFVKNPGLRRKFREAVYDSGYSQLNIMGMAACRAAYEHGADWVDQLTEYLAENINFARQFLAERLPKIGFIDTKGTYLVWLDFRAYGEDEAVNKRVINGAKLWLDRGTMFGAEGAGFQRVNVACPRSVLKKALEQLEKEFGR
ncbi:cystathionine beta-lyase [Clostridia bacterium]|nr:cystathionine beta-lyase [Clostridia bacterium]